jgi:hypothetical protein
MNRREAVKTAGLLVGGALVASTGLLAGCEQPPPREILYADDEALVAAIADTILPDTPGVPGARAVGVAPVIDVLLTRCRDAATQGRVMTGLDELRQRCRDHCNAPFADLPRVDRERLLRDLDEQARTGTGPHWFNDMHDLVMHAYFTSEAGMTQALRYVREPGRWVGCVPLQPGQRAWA